MCDKNIEQAQITENQATDSMVERIDVKEEFERERSSLIERLSKVNELLELIKKDYNARKYINLYRRNGGY